MKKFYKAMFYRFMFVGTCALSLYIIACGNTTHTNTVSDVNGVKSVEAIHIVTEYKKATAEEVIPVIPVNTMEEAAQYGPTNPVSFVGQMTAYKSNCAGCTGKVSCPPRQDVRNGNIYYNDAVYGTVRIMAADPHIPCGTIVKITNLTFTPEPVIGIVLDRGGLIKGNIMDFLIGENEDMNLVGRQRNVSYEVVRWGW